MALHFHKLTVKDIRKETKDCVSVAFTIPEEAKKDFLFIPGQNITVRRIINGEEIRRSYSVCSSPQENELRVAVKKVRDGIFSSYANDLLKPGEELEVLSPSGSFYTGIKEDQKKNYVFFAAGSGITPVISLIKTILAVEKESFVTLIYGNKNSSSIIFKEQLSDLKDKYLERFSLYHILSRELTDAAINHGRIDEEKCRLFSAIIDYNATDEFFICGPEQMIFTVKEFLEKKRIAKARIHFELFTTPLRKKTEKTVVVKDRANEGSEIIIKADGRSFSFRLDYDSNVILDAALAQGADLPFACKGGVCCTCKARLTEGQVEMETNYGLEPDEVKAGFILTCQSHPLSKKVILDFDIK
ncbi:MAG TPA: 1,2-phenylacetyl-CoA epoxidase subunit PaaE [Chitinophagaceae bacterium]|nr:1,2-phenylacetyl-CoA epoxidase subunit PaaE [Chitinophagaceae bacterium]